MFERPKVFQRNPTTVGERPSSMRRHISAAFLFLVLAALAGDIMMRSRPVHAQSSPTVYINHVQNNMGKLSEQITIKGTEVLGFSCAEMYCYVLSK
jgi:hypothetical protein